jgi:5-methylcytosine-specific restriction endonuclease McrA
VLHQLQALSSSIKSLSGVSGRVLGETSRINFVEMTVTPRKGEKMSNAVFVLDTDQKPLKMVHPAMARAMLTAKQAAVFRRYPFTIICHAGVSTGEASPLRLKIDPGSKTTGLAMLDGSRVLWAAELTHRGQRIQAALECRRARRRNRRQRKTRYRTPRFLNRTRPQGWLPPSLQSRVANVMTWVARLTRVAHITALSQEVVRFDTQIMQNAEITGVEYQQGELAGYEVREYLLEKWHRTCAYCGKQGVPLEVEHIVPKARGGSNRVTNLTLACGPCNQQKGSQTAAECGFPQIQAQAKRPLKDAAAVNATRWALYRALQATGLRVEAGTGGRTKHNRTRLGIAKSHWGDAACVGASTPDTLTIVTTHPLQIKAVGHGSHQVCGTDAFGFPNRHRGRAAMVAGCSTGDMVVAKIPTGKHAGVHTGRVTIRQRACFQLNGFSVHPKFMTVVHKKDGYAYSQAV